jgi:hypothetical protein
MTEAQRLLEQIIEVRQRMYDRCIKLKETAPGGISGDDIDKALLDLLQAKLELAKYTRF